MGVVVCERSNKRKGTFCFNVPGSVYDAVEAIAKSRELSKTIILQEAIALYVKAHLKENKKEKGVKDDG